MSFKTDYEYIDEWIDSTNTSLFFINYKNYLVVEEFDLIIVDKYLLIKNTLTEEIEAISLEKVENEL